MPTTPSRRNSANAAIDRAIRDAFATIPAHDSATSTAFRRLLQQARRSDLLRAGPGGGRPGEEGRGAFVAGLRSLADFDWIRPAEDWEPAGSGPLPRFASLAGHLLAAYPVPAFMASAWLGGMAGEARRRQRWYALIGSGRNIRHADLPLPYTRKMAHHFLQAPDHLSIDEALRWGQVRGMGGSKALARAVVATRLGGSFESEEFWTTVVRFFAHHPDFDLDQVGPVVEYLHHQRFVFQEAFAGGGEWFDLGPPQPDLTMKGRTPRSLIRQSREWHRRPRTPAKLAPIRWEPAAIAAYRDVEGHDPDGTRCWTIQELTCGEALRREGQAMQHCVGSYAHACRRRDTSIWSMRFEHRGRKYRVMTIQVDPATRTIVQARRRANAPPNEKTLGVMRRWAESAGLTFAIGLKEALDRTVEPAGDPALADPGG
ncbi:PcfJ domain-containing protein [Tundrisphaera sp. TA3]|uniref:PcfJ domain-containing protein n=1 Tax=Tundrisphaera sp. TA3 TaxID=3435775 RepID=UPI003EB8695C